MKTVIAFLTLLLFLSNVFWMYVFLDNMSIQKYREQERYELDMTRGQLMGMLEDLGKGASRASVIEAAVKHSYPSAEAFDEEGCTWVAWVGFTFTEEERLESVVQTCLP